MSLELGLFALLILGTSYFAWVLFNEIPTWGEMRLIGMTMSAYKLLVGTFWLAIIIDMPVTWLAVLAGIPIWIELLFGLTPAVLIAILYAALANRETFKPSKFFVSALPVLPIFTHSVSRVLGLAV